MPGICPRCQQKVYFAEEVRCQGLSWHKSCLKCENCRKQLDSSNLLDHSGYLYCTSCYRKLFGPRGYGFGGVMAEEEVSASVTNISKDQFFTPPASLRCSRNDQNDCNDVGGGGWVSPRLVKSAGKLLDNSNFQWIKSKEAKHLQEKNHSSSSGVKAVASAAKEFKQLSRIVIDQSRSSSSKPFSQSISKPSPASPTSFSPNNNNNWSSRKIPLQPTENTSRTVSDPQLVLRKAFNIPSSSKPKTSTSSSGIFRSSTPPPTGRFKPPMSKADLCQKCNKKVFQAEKCRAAGHVWHKMCFTCNLCNIRLDSNRLCERGGEIYCNNCYHRNFGPRGIGFGIGVNFQT